MCSESARANFLLCNWHELRDSNENTAICLRQHGTPLSSVFRFLRSASAKTEIQWKVKNRSAEGWKINRVARAIEKLAQEITAES
jgi:hypothetical protein